MVHVRTIFLRKKNEKYNAEMERDVLTLKKRRLLLGAICAAMLMSYSKAQTEKKEIAEVIRTEQEAYQTTVLSDVEKVDCYICGDKDESLMSYYKKCDSIGIVHWNPFGIIDSDVRVYDDDGSELLGQSGSRMRVCSFGDGYGSIHVSGTPNRGFTHAKVYYKEKDELDFSIIRKLVCQKCLDKAVKFYSDQKDNGKDGRIATTGYCLVDFLTGELYTLSDPYRGYFIRDYYVSYDIVEELDGNNSYIKLFLVYAPERLD